LQKKAWRKRSSCLHDENANSRNIPGEGSLELKQNPVERYLNRKFDGFPSERPRLHGRKSDTENRRKNSEKKKSSRPLPESGAATFVRGCF